MLRNKKMLILTSVLNLLPTVVGLILWNRLPPMIPSHWGIDGNVDGYMGRTFLVFGMPVLMLGLQWLCAWVSSKDNGNRNPKMQNLVLWIIPVITWITIGMSYCVALGRELSLNTVLAPMMGILFMLIGNYMPKCTQSRTMGVKIKWTLEDEGNWNATHRFAGKVWFFGGLILVGCVFLPEQWGFRIVLGAIFPIALSPAVYSYCYYRRQKKLGIEVERKPVLPIKGEKIIRNVALTMIALILIGCLLLMLTGKIQLEYGDTSFTVDATFWNPLTVEYAAIDRLEWTQEGEGERIYGYGSARLELGQFKNETFGTYVRYAYTNCENCILVEVNGEILIIGGASAEETEKIFQNIQEGMLRCK